MAKGLERDLGLYAVLTVSIGAMVGSGIFVLPGLALGMAGPSVVLAYLLAGLVVLPSALSKAEMATAMPEAGGTYLYIDRAMGPAMGTIAGLGAWFSLVLKAAFALVGLGAYLLILLPLLPGVLKLVSVGVGLVLVVVNVVGVGHTGRLQAIIVTGVLAVLVVFVAFGVPALDPGRFRVPLVHGPTGLLAATGFVFVSYAGVTKIASVAEEVEDPGRNIPRGILGSVLLMMGVYTLVVLVLVGTVDPGPLSGTLTPMALGAASLGGPVAGAILAGVAILALAGMANAGILSASRYPFAMSRDHLAPPTLARVHPAFRTPLPSILLTGGVLVVLVALVPVEALAELASAFQILVFTLVNVALIFLRESSLGDFDPVFRSPGYPWVQLLGIVGGVVLLGSLGPVPLAGALGVVLAGALFYRFYGRRRTTREGAATDALRGRTETTRLEATRRSIWQDAAYRVLVPVHAEIPRERERLLLRVAADLVRARGGRVQVLRFEEVPPQLGLRFAASEPRPQEVAFEERTDAMARALGVDVEVGEVVSHDSPRAIRNVVRDRGVDLVVLEISPEDGTSPLLGNPRTLLATAPCDVVLVAARDLGAVDTIAVVGEGGPLDPLKVSLTNALAVHGNATVRLVEVLKEGASDAREDRARAYHREVAELLARPSESVVVRSRHPLRALEGAVEDADLVVTEATGLPVVRRGPLGRKARHLVRRSPAPVLVVHARDGSGGSVARQVVQRVLY